MDLDINQLVQFASSGKLMYVLLAFGIRYLQVISQKLAEISKTMAVKIAVYDQVLEDHARRIASLESPKP